MIQEIINFTQNIDDQFINSGLSPKEGLHVMLNTITIDDTLKIDIDNFQYEIYSKKSKTEPSEFMNRCKLLHQNAWCINTNKCFDLPKKAIHTCSPFCVAFKREHLNGGKKFKQNESKNENQIYQRFGAYFEKAFSLFENEKDTLKFEVFKLFFTQNLFSPLINKIELENTAKRESLSEELIILKEQSDY
jgi:CRISPR-associated protein Csh1